MVRLRQVSFHAVPLRTRMPFRYGIAELREMPHLFVRAELEVDGRLSVGLSADNLPPKWFTKNPGTTYADDLKDMLAVIRAAGRHATDAGDAPSVFDLWQHTYAAQKSWAASTPHPPLLWNFGVSLIERATIDAFCRAIQTPFHTALRTGQLGPAPVAFLPAAPLSSIPVRHTVGLSDPLTAADIPPSDRLDDGLPQSLEDSIRAYNLRYFKIKLSGDPSRDSSRLRQLATLLAQHSPDYRYTLDGNENFLTFPPFRELWSSLTRDPALRHFLSRLIFVEQPLHRDTALSDETARALAAWPDRPPMIIDESDADLDSLPRALEVGYLGTSHKNCKGVFKSLASHDRLERLRLTRPGRPFILSGEDLTNTGPVALLQDLAVLATLNIPHAERNGHHYLRGLSQFPSPLQHATLTAHPDLYTPHPQGFITPRITDGQMSTTSVTAAPFGYAHDFDPAQFSPVA